MARMVRHDATGPHRIDPQEKPVFICACGLSKNLPYCDGSHAGCKDEQAGTLYIFDAARETVVDQKPDSPPNAPRVAD